MHLFCKQDAIFSCPSHLTLNKEFPVMCIVCPWFMFSVRPLHSTDCLDCIVPLSPNARLLLSEVPLLRMVFLFPLEVKLMVWYGIREFIKEIYTTSLLLKMFPRSLYTESASG